MEHAAKHNDDDAQNTTTEYNNYYHHSPCITSKYISQRPLDTNPLLNKMKTLTNCKSYLGNESYGLILLFISALLFSVMGVFLKLASNTGIPSTQMVFFRAVFQGFFVVLGLCTVRNKSLYTVASPMVLPSPPSSSSSSSSVLAYDEENTDRGISNDSTITNDKNDTHRNNENSSTSTLPPKEKLLICNPLGNTSREIRVVALRGFVGGCGFIMYYFSISVLPLGDAMTLFSLNPIHTLFLANIFLNEQIKCVQIVATVACVIGAILIAGPSFLSFEEDGSTDTHGESYNPFGYGTALLGSFFSASVIILIRKAGTLGVGALQLLFSWCIFGIFFSLIFRYIFLPLEGPWHSPPSREAWWYVFGMCFFGSSAHFLLNYAGRMAPAGLASIVRSSNIVMGYIWEIIIFGVIPTMTTIVGVLFILLALTIVAVQKWNDETEKESNKEIKIIDTTTTSRSCCESTFAKNNLDDPTNENTPTETTELIGGKEMMFDHSYNTSSEANTS